MRILMADDDPTTQAYLKIALEKLGYAVSVAKNGEEAWRLHQKEKFQLVLADWMMPLCDGPELIRRIRQTPNGSYTYVIMLTAKSEKTDLIEAIENGADDFLIKPVHIGELRVRLKSATRILRLENDLAHRLSEVSAANEHMRRDLDAAANIQRALLPESAPPSQTADFSWLFEPSLQVGGDIFNIFRLDETQVGMYVIDVSGHGAPAAMLAVTLSRILSPMPDRTGYLKQTSASEPGYRITEPNEVASLLNLRFPLNPETYEYFTILYGIFNERTREFRYVQAGHPSPAVVSRERGPRVLVSGGPPIGFFETPNYEMNSTKLEVGDRLYLFSDGIVEAPNPSREQFGEERMLKTLNDSRERSLDQSILDLKRDVRRWGLTNETEDDLTMVGMEVK